jgi:hypothetical protein
MLNSLFDAIANIFTHHKLFLALMFLLTAGHEVELPDWLNISIGLAMMWTVVITWLARR